MVCERLMWTFGGLFLLCGSPLFFVSDRWWAQLWGGLAMFSLGSFAIAFACDGVRKGELKIQHSLIRRADRPYLFWGAVTGVAAVGAGVVVGAIWIMYFKVWKV